MRIHIHVYFINALTSFRQWPFHIFRMVGTYFAVSCGSLNTKEKIFMAFAWMPKATVQAALGPVFLDNCIKYGKDEWQPMGEEILTLAVLSILITAPLGAVCILGMIKINISPQTLQLFTHLHINKYKGLLFYLDLKCLFCLSQPWVRSFWTTLPRPPRLLGVTRQCTVTRPKFATKSENRVWVLNISKKSLSQDISVHFSLLTKYRHEMIRSDEGMLELKFSVSFEINI